MTKKPSVVVIVINNARSVKSCKRSLRVGGLPPLPENCVYLYYDDTKIPVGVACYGKGKTNVAAQTKVLTKKLSKAYARFLGVKSLRSYCECITENGTTKCTCYYEGSKRLRRVSSSH